MNAILIQNPTRPMMKSIAYHPYCDFQKIMTKIAIVVINTANLIIHSLPSQSLNLINILEIAKPKKYMDPNSPIW